LEEEELSRSGNHGKPRTAWRDESGGQSDEETVAFCGNQEQNAFLSFFAAIPQE
jgi:hypothetical protein